ncbi:MAG: V-type ATP synthase subunit I [Nitrososphaera sp.]|jgi:V/A-type H+-transporting ATPase subunit I
MAETVKREKLVRSSPLKPVPMVRIAIVGLKKYRQVVISILHDMHIAQLEPLSKDAGAVLRTDKGSELHRQVSDQLLRIRGMTSVLPAVPVSSRVRFSNIEEVLDKAHSIDIDGAVSSLERQRENLLTRLSELENNIRLLDEFSFFPEDLGILNLGSARSFFGRVPFEKFESFRHALVGPNGEDVVLYANPAPAERQRKDKDANGKSAVRVIIVVSPRYPSHALATAVQTHGVHIEPVPKLSGKPSEIVREQSKTLSELKSQLAHIDSELAALSKSHMAELVSVEEQLEIENKKLEVIENSGSTTDAFAVEGWVPRSSVGPLRNSFQKHTANTTVVYELKTEEHPPTLMANPRRFKVFESFVRFYSLPSGDEFDPTVLFGLIFPVFYGLMLGDVGYATVILLVSRWVIRRVDGGKRDINIMPTPLRKFALTILKPVQMVKLARAMTPGAIIAIILGFCFNLYFGFHLNQYLFNYLNDHFGTHLPPDGAFLDPIGTYGLRKLLLFSGYVGLGMVSFGLILGILNSLREGEKKHVVGKLGWLVFGWGIVLLGLALLHHQHVNPVRHIEGVGYFALILGGIGLMFYGEGVRAIMELPSIISHILSYTRIVGILLASVILADVIDYIFVKTLHHSIPYVILGVLIFFIGHIFNIILGVFEPGIQGARLIYVEFFSKFYHGNGRPFRPFGSRRSYTYEQYQSGRE